MKMETIVLCSCYVFMSLATGAIFTQASDSSTGIDLNQAELYFNEAQEQCDKDNGRLWGQSLCVPMAFINPETRQLVANQQDSAGILKKVGQVFVGTWPENLAIANSTKKWCGTSWTILIWPLPNDRTARVSLMLHESYHNIQEVLGFPAIVPRNSQLGTSDGRFWLRMEWAALRAALKSKDADRLTKIKDALIFRAYRRELFEGSAVTERQLEMHEGLAEYTGLRLCGLSLATASIYLADTAFYCRLMVPSFETSFAYISGPAYGLLLDATKVKWREHLKPTDDLGTLLQSALDITLPKNIHEAAEEQMLLYDGESIRSWEIERELEHLRIIANYRANLVEGPVLIIPLRQMNIQYDPTNIVSLDDLGTVYPSITVSDLWGILTVTKNGALMSPTWNQLTVPAPTNMDTIPLVGEGWTLELKSGWKIISAEREGDFTISN